MAQNSNEEEEQSAGELIIHRARVHGAVARQEGSAQDTHVVPLGGKKNDGMRKEESRGYETRTRYNVHIISNFTLLY